MHIRYRRTPVNAAGGWNGWIDGGVMRRLKGDRVRLRGCCFFLRFHYFLVGGFYGDGEAELRGALKL